MGKYSAPPKQESPSVTAGAQSTANENTAATQQILNMQNQYGPYGSITYAPRAGSLMTADGKPIQWDVTTTQSPEQDYIRRLGEQGDIRTAETGLNMFAGLRPTLETPLNFGQQLGSLADWSRDAGMGPSAIDFNKSIGDVYDWSKDAGFSPGSVAVGDTARSQLEDAMFNRLNPQIERDRSRMETQLANQGITRGSEAYNQAQKQLEDQISNQRLDILMRGGEEARQQALAESGLAETRRNQIMGIRDVKASELAQQQADAENIARYQRGEALNLRGNLANELLQQREIPLNELIGMFTGSQTQFPGMISGPQTGIAPTDYMGAQQAYNQNQLAGYNQKQSANSAMMGTGATAAATIAAAAIAAA